MTSRVNGYAFDYNYNLKNNFENNAWSMGHNTEQVDILISKNQALQILYL